MIKGCLQNRFGNGLCQTHYDRIRLGIYLITWKELFTFDNPPTTVIGKIPLTKGKHSIVDAKDYERCREHEWCFNDVTGYVYTAINDKKVTLHRFLMDFPESDVDHINRNKLDNRMCNLRCATRSQNSHNSISRGGTSKFKGVCWNKSRKKWQADIMVNRKKISLGRFDLEKEAARAYDRVAIQYLEDRAITNFLPENDR